MVVIAGWNCSSGRGWYRPSWRVGLLASPRLSGGCAAQRSSSSHSWGKIGRPSPGLLPASASTASGLFFVNNSSPVLLMRDEWCVPSLPYYRLHPSVFPSLCGNLSPPFPIFPLPCFCFVLLLYPYCSCILFKTPSSSF